MSADSIKTRIEEILRVRGWTAGRLTKEAGLSSPAHVRNLLDRGAKRPAAKTLAQIARAAGVREEWLSSGLGPMEEPPPVLAPAVESVEEYAPEETDPRMRNRENFDASLRGAKQLRPGHPDYIWPVLANADPLLSAPLSPLMLAELADFLLRHVAPPPDVPSSDTPAAPGSRRRT